MLPFGSSPQDLASHVDLNDLPVMRSIASTTSINLLFDTYPRKTTATATTTPTSAVLEVSLLSDLSTLLDRKTSKTIVVVVGLPASGKSTVAKQLCGHLADCGYSSRIYNAGNMRRQQKLFTFNDSEFFNPTNTAAKSERENYATMTMAALLEDVEGGRVNVGFLDATNTTVERRNRMLQMVRDNNINATVVVLDVQTTSQALINFNINGKAFNVDYRGKDYDDSIRDFKRRTEHYFQVYAPVLDVEMAQNADLVSMYARIVNAREYLALFPKPAKTQPEIVAFLNGFLANYFDAEGKRYYEAVDAFYRK